MKSTVEQSVGVDISKDTLDVGVKRARTGSKQVHEQNLVFTTLSHSSGNFHLACLSGQSTTVALIGLMSMRCRK
jgi:hypothetical protein